MNKIFRNILSKYFLTVAALCSVMPPAKGQPKPAFTHNTLQTFTAAASFIENKSQYDFLQAAPGTKRSVLFGYEGMGMPVLFTKTGLVHHFQQVKFREENERKKEEREVEKERDHTTINRSISMEWAGADTSVNIAQEEKTTGYHTYPFLAEKAYGYKKLIYTNLYKGIDLVYGFGDLAKPGFEYTLIVNPGASVNAVSMRYSADVKAIKLLPNGNLLVKSDIGGMEISKPIAFYKPSLPGQKGTPVKCSFRIRKNEISFFFPDGYDTRQTLIIDPFVSSASNLDGYNAGKAKDIDFDYQGNVYVSGGGDSYIPTGTTRLAKYDANGSLQWTFNGQLPSQSWQFGVNFGGWVVEKTTGKTYLGQGFAGNGFRVIRLGSDGLYDNYITSADPAFLENWRMLWNCNNGTPQILIAGGGVTSDINLGVFNPVQNTINPLNITALNGFGQDITDMVIDPVNNDIYTLFSQGILLPNTPPAPLSNKLYKNAAPYSAASGAWNTPTGYVVLSEVRNRPYLVNDPTSSNDNSANILALNNNYLFYWDGKNLKAFDKSTGSTAGNPLITSNTVKMQGGIFADACNNVFVGDANGIIKVYRFDGSNFDDAPADLSITGFAGRAVYDLTYNEADRILYACGDGFIVAFDLTGYCGSNVSFTLTAVSDCSTGTVTASLSPAAPSGSVVTYTLYSGSTVIASNSTGVFTNPSQNGTYRAVATINQDCSGTQVSADFNITVPVVSTTLTNETCGSGNGQIVAVAGGTTAPYQYSLDGIAFSSSGTFSNLAAGNYTITVRDANGCISSTPVVLLNTNAILLNISSANTSCGNSNGSITMNASGGTTPYQYSIDNGTNYQLSNQFTGLSAGQYLVKVKDAGNCFTSTFTANIAASAGPTISTNITNAGCGSSTGSITVVASGTAGPFLYAINGGVYQPSPLFNNLLPGTYTVSAKDNNQCVVISQPLIVANAPQFLVTANTVNANCGLNNGRIIANATGGSAPYQYSLNGGNNYQSSGIFTGLAGGPFTVTVKDANGCLVTINSQVSVTPLSLARIFAGADTTISINEPLQLNAVDLNNTGFSIFEWSPATGLNDSSISNPIAILNRDISYTLTAITADGCRATDIINIKVSTESSIYVPNAFSPNGDGLNDLFRPRLNGIRLLKYFRVYNRYGQPIYQTSSKDAGWDGKLNGKYQNAGSYVWMLEAVDYSGKTWIKKGLVILLK